MTNRNDKQDDPRQSLPFSDWPSFLRWAQSNQMQGQGRDWMRTGRSLGTAFLIARMFRMPLATVFTLLPFLMPQRGRGWAGQETGPVRTASAMTRAEAAQILGVAPTASKQEVREAHRRLIARNHPDQGGTDYLAAKINEARGVLLG